MLTRRGWIVLGTGGALYLASRLSGSPDLHIVGVGVLLLPLLGLGLIRWSRQRIRVTRRVPRRRVYAGERIRVDLDARNLGPVPSSMILLEDRLPAALGRAARAVLEGLGPRARQRVSYTLTCGRRGRYQLGPLGARLTDPFGLAHQRVDFLDRHELIVYPPVEDLRGRLRARSAGGSGETSTRQLFRTGEEFYTMRPYEIGDDLRRIHWPSTARWGDLMIRQDEAGRRASVTLFLDTRRVAYASETAFERAVSAAASIGSLYLREGVAVRLAGVDLPPRGATADAFLEALAVLEPSDQRAIDPSLLAVRDRGATGSTLIVVTRIPPPEEQTSLLGAAAGYGARVAVLIDPAAADPDADPARAARVSLARGGWRAILVPPDRPLRETWTERHDRPITATAGS